MVGIQGIDEFEEFAEDMTQILGQGQSDGIKKAKRDALRQTADDFLGILKEQIIATDTAKGGTLYSRTSPYEPGTTNESSKDNLHMRNKNAWNTEIVGDDFAVIYPATESVHNRASLLEYGTADHGASGDTPMFFHVGGATIVVTEKGESNPFEGEDAVAAAFSDTIGPDPGEVEGVEPQGFFRKSVQVANQQGIWTDNMERELKELFAEQGLPLE